MTSATDAPRSTGRSLAARPRGALWTWLAVGVVVALAGTLVLVKVVGSSTEPRTTTPLTPTSQAVLAEVSGIPASVYDAVGASSPAVPIVAPGLTSGAPRLYFTSANGVRRPGVLYLGTEYCSFCAAERWALIAALARFGTFHALFDMASSPLDYAPATPTFTFYGATYDSRLIVFRGYEVQSDVPTPTGHEPLMRVPRRYRAVADTFDPAKKYPFVDVGNVAIVLQAGFSPETLAGLSREQVAASLHDPSSPVTRAIVASANLLSAGICAADGQRPSSVCGSAGVTAADSRLHLGTG